MSSNNRDVNFFGFLSKEWIISEFNLSSAPWWGEWCERLTGLTKQNLYKSIGKLLLTWSELEEVLSDIEVNLNSQPLIDTEVDMEYPELTTNSMILGRDVKSPYYYPEEEEVSDNWKDNRDRCKEAA